MTKRKTSPPTAKVQTANQRAYPVLFKFSAEDLHANSAGALSRKQRTDLTTMLVFQLLLGVPLYSFLTLVILGNLFQIPVAGWIAGLFQWQDGPALLSFGVPWLIVAVLALLVSSPWWLPRWQDYRVGKVQTVTGRPADARSSPWNGVRMLLYLPRASRRRYRKLVHLTVNDVPLTLNEAQHDLITTAKHPLTFYYLPRSKQVIAVTP